MNNNLSIKSTIGRLVLILTHHDVLDLPLDLGQEVIWRDRQFTVVDLGDVKTLSDEQRAWLSDPRNDVQRWTAISDEAFACLKRDVLHAKVAASFAGSKNVHIHISARSIGNG